MERKTKTLMTMVVYMMIAWNILMVGCILALYPQYLRTCMVLKHTQGNDPSTCLLTRRFSDWVQTKNLVAQEYLKDIAITTMMNTCDVGISYVKALTNFIGDGGIKKWLMNQIHETTTTITTLSKWSVVYLNDAVVMRLFIHPSKSWASAFLNRIYYVKHTVEECLTEYHTTISTSTNMLLQNVQSITEQIGRFYINNIGQTYIIVIGMLAAIVCVGM